MRSQMPIALALGESGGGGAVVDLFEGHCSFFMRGLQMAYNKRTTSVHIRSPFMLQVLAALGGLLVSLPALAVTDVVDTVPSLRQSTNSVWIVVTGSLVFFMQAGFALLESGMSRSKNATNVIMKNYCDMCYGGLIYWLVGYGIMFGSNPTGWFGTDHFFLTHTEPLDYTWMFFQMMFAATSATIVSGALAERTRFWGYLLGSVVITGFISP